MFISVLDLFKVGIGPSSSHTLGPMVAAHVFLQKIKAYAQTQSLPADCFIECVLKGSLAFTGKGHATDHAIALGIHGYTAQELAGQDVEKLLEQVWQLRDVDLAEAGTIQFIPAAHIIFDTGEPLPQHPNGMIFSLKSGSGQALLTETYFSIGGGFINTLDEIEQLVAPLKMESATSCPYPFASARQMLKMGKENNLSIAQMKRANELTHASAAVLNDGLDAIWIAMCECLEQGLRSDGILPGGLKIQRRAKALYDDLVARPERANLNDWLCAYAMAVNEENAAGHRVVTAPTNGAAGVIPAVMYYLQKHEQLSSEQTHDFLLTAAAIGGLIKHRSSISGAEVGCQGEVGSASAMAAAGICAVKGGSVEQVENAAEIALEHHLGMTCDPVKGLVQVPCIERNGFGAIKAYTAASLALRGSGTHFMPLDSCIAAMKQTGLEMSAKYKETAQGGLAVSITEC